MADRIFSHSVTLRCQEAARDTVSATISSDYPGWVRVEVREGADTSYVSLSPEDARVLANALLDMAAQAARAEG